MYIITILRIEQGYNMSVGVLNTVVNHGDSTKVCLCLKLDDILSLRFSVMPLAP